MLCRYLIKLKIIPNIFVNEESGGIMKKLRYGLFLFCLLLCMGITASAATPELIAHRGFATTAPENTMAAYRLAAAKGYDGIECDLAFTKDNVPVLLHDATINRTSNGKGKPGSYTFAQLRKLDFGKWKSSKYKGEKIPSLQELLTLCKQKNISPYVELKEKRGFTKSKLKIAYGVAKKLNMHHKVVWFSTDFNYLLALRSIDPAAKIGYLAKSPIDTSMIKNVTTLKNSRNTVYIAASLGKYSNKVISTCKQKGIKIFGWYVTSRKQLTQLDPYFTGALAEGI